MKKYIKPEIDSLEVFFEDIVLVSFVEGGHSIFDYNDEV